MKRTKSLKSQSQEWLLNGPKQYDLPVDLHCILSNAPPRGSDTDVVGEHPEFEAFVSSTSVSEHMYHILLVALHDLSRRQAQWVVERIQRAYHKVQPGTSVGTIAANSVASVLLQATLDTFHRTGIRGSDTSNAVKSVCSVLHNSKKPTPLFTLTFDPVVRAPRTVRDALRGAKMVDRGIMEFVATKADWAETQLAFRTEHVETPGGDTVVRFLATDRDPYDAFSTVSAEEMCQSISYCALEELLAEPWVRRFQACFPAAWERFAALNGPCLRMVLCENNPEWVAQALSRRLTEHLAMVHNHFTHDRVPLLVVRGRVRPLDSCPPGIQVFRDLESWYQAHPDNEPEAPLPIPVSYPLVNTVLKHTVRGFPGAEKTVVRDNKLHIYGHCQYYDIVKKALANDIVNVFSLWADNPQIMFETLGIEAARSVIIARLIEILGDNVHPKNIQLIADCMTYHGSIRALNRHDFLHHNNSFFAKATFEEAVRSLSNAAMWGVEEPVDGASQKIALGQLIKVGTGYSDLVLDADMLDESRPPPDVHWDQWGSSENGFTQDVYEHYPIEAPPIMYNSFNNAVRLSPAPDLDPESPAESEYESESDG